MNNFINNLGFISNIAQLKSYGILLNDFNNTDLMKYLAHQDNLLDTIIRQNEEILNLLKRRKQMDIEEIIQKIVDDGRIEDMHELSDILEDTLEMLEKYDKECYKEYEMRLYEMAYGQNLSKEIATQIVHNMQPYGQKWSIEETRNIQEQFGMNNINPIDFYTTLNMAYNDYNNLFQENLDMYVTFADDFINDIDGKPHKVFKYFM